MSCEAVTSSGQKSANAAIVAMPSLLSGFTLVGGSAASTLTIYDNATTNSGTILDSVTAAIGVTVQIEYNAPVIANNGIYAVVSGTGATYTVRFSIGG